METKDFNKLMVKFHNIPGDESIIDNTILKDYPEFKQRLKLIDMNSAIKYLICCYDRNSPFRKEYDDIDVRKKEAAIFSELQKDKEGNFSDKVVDIMLCNNQNFNTMILRYCRMQYSSDYSYLTTIEDTYHKALYEIRQDKDNKDLAKNINNWRKEIGEIRYMMLAEDNNENLKADFFKYLDNQNLKIFPEDIAEYYDFRKDVGLKAKKHNDEIEEDD